MSEKTPKNEQNEHPKKVEWAEDLSPSQKLVLNALKQSNGVVTTACDAANVSRTQFYKWLNEIEEFKQRVEEINEAALDFAESALFGRIKDGSDTAIIFFLKTKGKKRGYTEKTEIEHSGGITFEVSAKDLTDDQLASIATTGG